MADLLALAEAVGEDASLRGEDRALRLELLIRVRRGVAGGASSPEDFEPPLRRPDGRLVPVRDRWGNYLPPADPRRLPRGSSIEDRAVLADWLTERGYEAIVAALPSGGYRGICPRRPGWDLVDAAIGADPIARQLLGAM